MLRSTKRKELEKAPTRAPQRGLIPFEDIDQYFAELEQSLFNQNWLRPFPWLRGPATAMPFEGRMPKVDVIDHDDDILIKAEIPGIEKDDLDISVSDNIVMLTAEARREEKEEEGNYYRHEISRGSFSRSIPLPAAVDIENAKAKFKDGILELTLPKTEKSTRKKIKVE